MMVIGLYVTNSAMANEPMLADGDDIEIVDELPDSSPSDVVDAGDDSDE